MRGISAHAVARQAAPFPADQALPLRGLLAPLPYLLRSGGDDRLALLPKSLLNEYGCAPVPRTGVVECASTTATTISERAYERAEIARLELLEAAISEGFDTAFDVRIEAMRCELRTLLGIGASNVEIVFAPSGTDATLSAAFIAREILGGPFISVLVGADETGSGIPLAAAARHFSNCAALGSQVAKAMAVEGFAHASTPSCVALRDVAGRPLDLAAIDQRVLDTVEATIKKGQRVLLHAMDCSKTGLSGPSLECLDHILRRWPSDVLVVVDACQMRLGRAKLARYLARHFMVLITGSKFFTGPPFSGALLVPPAFADGLSAVCDVPRGLAQYTSAPSWPRAWRGIRASLPTAGNLGEWLRWEAALEEMRAYFAIPADFRSASLQRFSDFTSGHIAGIAGLEPVETGRPPGQCDGGEMGIQTIFPFLVSPEGMPLNLTRARQVYRDLASASAAHLGQPVALDGGRWGALRVSASARLVSQSWCAGDAQASQRKLEDELARIGTALETAAALAANKHME